jgi:hypothetical protein
VFGEHLDNNVLPQARKGRKKFLLPTKSHHWRIHSSEEEVKPDSMDWEEPKAQGKSPKFMELEEPEAHSESTLPYFRDVKYLLSC